MNLTFIPTVGAVTSPDPSTPAPGYWQASNDTGKVTASGVTPLNAACALADKLDDLLVRSE